MHGHKMNTGVSFASTVPFSIHQDGGSVVVAWQFSLMVNLLGIDLRLHLFIPRHSKRLRVLINVHGVVFRLVERGRVKLDGLDFIVMILFIILVLGVEALLVGAIFSALVQHLLLRLVHFVQLVLRRSMSMKSMEHGLNPVLLFVLGLEILLVQVTSLSILQHRLFFLEHFVVVAFASAVTVDRFEHIVQQAHLDRRLRRGGARYRMKRSHQAGEVGKTNG